MTEAADEQLTSVRAPGGPTETRRALGRLAEVLRRTAGQFEDLAERCEHLRDELLQGLSLAEAMAAEPRPLIITSMTRLVDDLTARLVIARKGQFGPDFDRSWAQIRQAEAKLDPESEGARVLLHYLKALLHLARGAFDPSIDEWQLALAQARMIHHRVLEGAASSHLGIALRRRDRWDRRSTPCGTAWLWTSAATRRTGSPSPWFTLLTPC